MTRASTGRRITPPAACAPLQRRCCAPKDKAPKDVPNIIFLQLESFFDVNRLKDVTFSENPVPYFEELKETCPSGYFTAPSVGAGHGEHGI